MKVFFLGWAAQYEKHFIKYLSARYGAEHLESPKVLRRLQRLTRILGGAYSGALFGGIYCRMNGFGRTDLLVCNEATIPSKINPEIIKAFPGKKVLLVRDLVDAPFLEKWSGQFDAIYSFDREQCTKLGMRYLDQFLPIGYQESAAFASSKEARPKQLALFIGREKGRGAILLDLAAVLKDAGCEVDFRIVADKETSERTPYHIDSTIDYYEMLKATLSADALVEINQPGQAGFTLRTLEAAYYGKKLITNNASIKESPLYHPNNVMVLGDRKMWTPDALRDFLALPFETVAQEILYKYSPDLMLESLLAEHMPNAQAARLAA